jgi:cytochrome oxidase Cu insertion factor (SCO1/SenC/PrrC family)
MNAMRRCARTKALGLFALASFALAAAEAPRFEPPAPGSYELPPIFAVAEHTMLDADGRPAPLLGIGPGEAALVSFVYLGCPDACPAATAVLGRLDAELAAASDLSSRVQLVTVSFDPANDPPARMAALRGSLAPRGRWRFLTAASPEALAPVLADYRVDASPSHVLEIFLVDGERRVRNIYSTGFLDVRLLRADLETLLGGPAPRSSSSSSSVRGQSALSSRESARSASSRPPVWQRAQ